MAFLITHQGSGKKILFDAGARKDYWNYSPMITERFATGVNVKGMRVRQGIHEVLGGAGVQLDKIESVVWRYEVPSCKVLRNGC